jgi:hypothetical protein
VSNAIILLFSLLSIFRGKGVFEHKVVGGNGKVECKVVFENCTRYSDIMKFIKTRKM